MMRKILSVAVFACALMFAGTAGAGLTVDLIWQDTGTAALTLTVPVPNTGGPGSQCGHNQRLQADGLAGRCMHVQWTVDGAEGPLFFGSNSVSFTTGAGLQGLSASFLNACPAACSDAGINGSIAVGKGAFFTAFPDPTVDINNLVGTIGFFTGAVNQTPPGDGTTGLAPGTYNVGTIIWDTSSATGVIDIASFINPLIDLFLASGGLGNANVTITDVTLNGATLNLVPEPGTASLLGLGLMGLIVASRRRNG
jgi:hypothetical protein